MDAIYEVRGLTKRYGRTAALNGVDFAVTPGKLVGLLGPNGSGKTTLMKISAGLLQPTAGSVIIDKVPVGVFTKAVTSYLPDRMALPTEFTADDAVSLYADFFTDFDKVKANALLAGPQSFEAASYDGTAYAFDADDARLVLVNANLPYAEEPAPVLAAMTDDSTIQLEAEAAEACRAMLEAAKADGIELVLNAGYLDADGRSAVYETQKQAYLDAGKTEEQAASLAEDIQPRAECSEHGTGYAVDILSADYTTRDTGFAATRAYEWLTAYAAEYGFILRYPQDRQAATGVVFEPWHWRYVGTENALAIRASGLSLEEFLTLQRAS